MKQTYVENPHDISSVRKICFRNVIKLIRLTLNVSSCQYKSTNLLFLVSLTVHTIFESVVAWQRSDVVLIAIKENLLYVNVMVFLFSVYFLHSAVCQMSGRTHGRPQTWTRGAFSPFWKCKVFLCISSHSKMLSRRIIYALFSQPVVSFWGQSTQTPTEAPSQDLTGGSSSSDH